MSITIDDAPQSIFSRSHYQNSDDLLSDEKFWNFVRNKVHHDDLDIQKHRMNEFDADTQHKIKEVQQRPLSSFLNI